MSDTKDTQKRVVGRPFVSGDPRANPGGRPRVSKTNTDMLHALTPKVIQRWAEGLDAERPVVVGNGPHAHMAMVPDMTERRQSGKQIWEALYGKPAQEITGNDGGPLFGQAAADTLEAIRTLAKDK
jgi:hypothetical protein